MRPALIAAVVLVIASTAHAQSGAFERDSTLDNLHHAPSYVTGRLGELGRVVRHGSGPVDVLLIAGWGFGAEDFEPFMRAHSTRYRMVAVTLPGFGGTPAPPMPPPGTSYGDGTWTKAAEEAVLRLIKSERLDRPIVLGHFIVSPQLAVRMAHANPDLIGGLVLIGAEPMRIYQSRGTGAPHMPVAERAARIDTALAPRWYKTVTKNTWLFNNYRQPQYARDSVRAEELWQKSAAVPLPVMIRYLCEYYAMDLREMFAALSLPTRVLVPSFSPAIFADPLQSYVKPLFVDAWGTITPMNPRVEITTVPDSRIFVTDDQPEVVRAAIDAVAHARLPRR